MSADRASELQADRLPATWKRPASPFNSSSEEAVRYLACRPPPGERGGQRRWQPLEVVEAARHGDEVGAAAEWVELLSSSGTSSMPRMGDGLGITLSRSQAVLPLPQPKGVVQSLAAESGG